MIKDYGKIKNIVSLFKLRVVLLIFRNICQFVTHIVQTYKLRTVLIFICAVINLRNILHTQFSSMIGHPKQ